MLSPYRVIDLTDSRAALGPMILADLGADVVKVEPPGGDPERATPSDPDGLCFAAYNRNKRSACLDLEQPDGRDAFLRLIASSDFLFENASPGDLAARGLGFDDLAKVNRRLVHVATTPFGQDGPHAGHQATDLTLAAMGGMMALNGDPDRPPLRISVAQTWLHAAAESAVAALVAHRRTLQTGESQFVDVSVQAAVFWTLMNGMLAAAIQGGDFERNGGRARIGSTSYPQLYPCVDGDSAIALGLLRTLPSLVRLMVEDGVVPRQWLTDDDWPAYFERFRAGERLTHPLPEVIERIETFTRKHSRRELLKRGLAAGISCAPVNALPEVLALEQFDARRFWRPLALPAGPNVRMPGPFVRLSRTPRTQRSGVPAVGEHTEAILDGSLGAPASCRPGDAAAPPINGELPFSGLKVADFSWVGVAPMAAKYLADHGAATVRVESATHLDVLRRGAPFKDGVPGMNRSQYFGSFNTSKWSIALDLKNPAGKEVARRLLAWADVCLESFTPGTMTSLGLDYSVAHSLNPSIIWASSCLMGQTGPLAALAGFGYHAAAISGFTALCGWPDRRPSNPFPPYTDTIANRFLGVAIMAALEHRRRTGEGQYIEQSQAESSLHFLTQAILDYQVNGAVPSRQGNASAAAAPHNAYPCAGEDQWCAIAVETDEQWRALRSAMGEPDWARDSDLATAASRIARRDEIDTRMGKWTRSRDRYDLMQALQAVGVPAGVVQRSSDLLHDPQLAHRRFFRPMVHPEMGEVPYEGHQFRIRGYDSGPRSPAPCLGEHSIEVMRDLLGMSDDEIAEVVASGALI